MQLVCCSLPETSIAGQSIGLDISLDVAWLLSLSATATPNTPSVGECSSENNVPAILACSPTLLLWALSQLELHFPVCHPDQLVDKIRRLECSQLQTGFVPNLQSTNRLEIRTARFVSRLKELSTKPVNMSGLDCKMNQAFAMLASRITGIDGPLMAKWIEQRQIADSFWVALAKRSLELHLPEQPIGALESKSHPVADSERLHLEKMASLKRLAYGASHEINNPLANIASRAQTLLRDEKDGERRKTLAKINQQAFRAFEMIADMMLFAHPPQLVIADTELKPLLQTVVSELQDIAIDQGTEIDLDCFASLVAKVDGGQLSVAIRAVIQNAIESMQKGGKVSVNARLLEKGDILDIVITDTGPGFRESELDHVFDPFFSGREAGRGLGFGLPKAWRIVEQHGGEIVAENLPHAGARVEIRIPYRVPTNR